ncbi:hypothetical protein V5O48_015397 [Marasmius crinis-equi]|uniref:Uncharacterized protein n=1 Tax=Marasmius crinis-equi TaxID=585013 RepID=A0ABR3EUN1_9AGAR
MIPMLVLLLRSLEVNAIRLESPVPATVTVSQPFTFAWQLDDTDPSGGEFLYLFIDSIRGTAAVDDQMVSLSGENHAAFTMTPTATGDYNVVAAIAGARLSNHAAITTYAVNVKFESREYQSKTPPSAIIGGVIGGIVIITAIFLVIFVQRRNQVRKNHHNFAITALPAPSEFSDQTLTRMHSSWGHPHVEAMREKRRWADRVIDHGRSDSVQQSSESQFQSSSTDMSSEYRDLAERIARLEAEQAPPDYVSSYTR